MKKIKLGNNFFRELDVFYKGYELRNSEENLNGLLNVYQRIQPDWVERFNNLHQRLLNKNKIKEKTFNDFVVVQLPKKYTVQNLKAPKNKNNDPFVDVMQRGRIIHLANKIAHCFERIFDSNLKKYLRENGLDSISKSSFEEVKKLVKKVYNPTTKEEVIEKAKTILQEKYGFAKMDFEEGVFSDKDFISPSYINLSNPKLIEIDEMYYSTLIAVNYYREQEDLILKNLIDTNINMNISVFYEKQDSYKTIRELTYHIGNSRCRFKDPVTKIGKILILQRLAIMMQNI